MKIRKTFAGPGNVKKLGKHIQELGRLGQKNCPVKFELEENQENLGWKTFSEPGINLGKIIEQLQVQADFKKLPDSDRKNGPSTLLFAVF